MILYFLDKSLTDSNGTQKNGREKRLWRIELGDEEEAEGFDGDTGVNTNVKGQPNFIQKTSSTISVTIIVL